jgi:adenosylcobinamide-GDP ribazoletransferase
MNARAREEAAALALALQFLTRLPLPRSPSFTPARMSASLRYYPAVGALVGGVGAAVLLLAAQALPLAVSVLLSLTATLALTGALHEDGLADTFDGLGGRTRERSLEIMRDSRIGSYGVLALGLVLAGKVAALLAMPVGLAAAALVAGHAASRLSAVILIATSRYLRPTGTGGFTAAGIGATGLAVATATGLVCLLGLLAWQGAGAALAATAGLAAGHVLARLVFERRLGGFTGDCLGAAQQLSELGLYLGLLAWI